MSGYVLDLAGIGIGPFNLSLAAQLDGIPRIQARFFERRRKFAWHPGMMLPGVELQTSFLKDLVTATSPTSPWSFLAYLVAHKRFYSFINAEFEAIPRREFADYLAWVAGNLGSLQFSAEVREVAFERDGFAVVLDDVRHVARNIALGVGLTPCVPCWAEPALGEACFHSSEAVHRLPGMAGERVAVIGGGQSGAEIVLHLLSVDPKGRRDVAWITRRPNFEPLDATPFTNELFTPGYVQTFHGLGEDRRRAALRRQKLAGDGASPSTLRAIYRRLYCMRHLERGEVDVILRPHREVIQMDRQKNEFRLIVRNALDGGLEISFADVVVLATGYAFTVPEVLAPLRNRIAVERNGNLALADDFSLKWDGPRQNRIFVLNAGKFSHGIAEPQLSLMAWRSAVIVNSLLGEPHFDLDLPPPLVHWTANGEDYRQAAESGLVSAGS